MKIKHYSPNLILIIFALLVMIGCSQETESPSPSPTPPEEPITITIGCLADLTTHVGDNYDWDAFRDTLDYYNDQSIIPGVKFDIAKYDTQFDSAKDIAGYHHLKQNGVYTIYAITGRSPVRNDQFPVFVRSNKSDAINPSGDVFGIGTLPQYEIATLLKWIAKNEWDWESKGPAKIGAAALNVPYSKETVEGLKSYCDAHSEQFELIATFLTDYNFNWGNMIQELHNCDYVLPPTNSSNFIEEFKELGYHTTYIGTDAHLYFLNDLDERGLLSEIDGMLLVQLRPSLDKDGEFSSLVKAVANNSNRGDIERLLSQPVYLSTVYDTYIILSAIEHSITKYGYANFNSQTLYQALQTFSIEIDGCSHSFSDTKRTSNDTLGIYRIDAENEALVRADPDWIPIMTEP